MSNILTSIPFFTSVTLPGLIACFDHNVLTTREMLKILQVAGAQAPRKKGPNGEVPSYFLAVFVLFSGGGRNQYFSNLEVRKALSSRRASQAYI